MAGFNKIEAPKAQKDRNPFLVFGLLTGAWILFGGVIAFQNGCITSLSCLPANEWGDFFSGFFAPLAFIWLVAAVYLQSNELRAQREELTLTRKEFELNREVLSEQAAEARKQANFIEEQTRLLAEDSGHRKRMQNLTSFTSLIDRYIERSAELRLDLFVRIGEHGEPLIIPPEYKCTPEKYISIQSEWVRSIIEVAVYDAQFILVNPRAFEELYSYLFAAEELVNIIPFYAHVSWKRSDLSELISGYGELFSRSGDRNLIEGYLRDRSSRISQSSVSDSTV